MDKREEIIIEKYQKAEGLRQEREEWRKKSIEDKFRGQVNEMRKIEKVAELEVEAKIAWKFKESRNAINVQKKILDARIQTEILKLKVKQDMFRQDRKIIRVDKPKAPKVDPLPYLRKNKTLIESSSSEGNSLEIAEVSMPKGNNNLRMANATPNPLKNVKIKYGERHISPQIRRNKCNYQV